MITPDQDLKDLREQYGAISGRLSKLSIISLSTILLLVIPFSRACQQASGEDINAKVQEINQLSEISGQCPRLSYIFMLFPKKSTCDPPISTVFKKEDSAPPAQPDEAGLVPAATASSTQYAQNVSEQSAEEQQRTAAEEAERQRLKDEAINKQNELAANLDAYAHKMFTVTPSLLGAELEFDLRYWIFLLPFIVWSSAIHFSILRKKLSLLRDIASSKLSTVKADDVEMTDRLMFGRQGTHKSAPFLSHPSRFEVFIYVTCATLPVLYMFISSFQFWGYWDWRAILFFVEIILLFSYYAVAYAHMVNSAMDEQVKELLGIAPRRGVLEWIWLRLKQIGHTISRLGRFKPRVSLLTWQPAGP
jgi:hypothetical protein